MNSRIKTKTVNTLTPIMPPGIRPGEIPPFHKLGEYTFQELCRELFYEEPGVATCDVYGKRGQSQDGIDLLSHRQSNDGIEVGQCKCCEKFSSNQIRNASDDFFTHWGRWSNEDVKRFILFVACDLSRRDQQDQIIKQRKRFKTFGIIYEAWSGAKIRNRLRSKPGIVSTYLNPPDYWLQVICGQVPLTSPWRGEVGPQPSLLPQLAIVEDVGELILEISDEIEQHLESMREAWREGRRQEAAKWIKGLRKNGKKWQIIPPKVKAKLLRFQASLELDITGNTVLAKQLVDEAKELSPFDNDLRLRALVAYHVDGPEAAIKLLEGQEDIDSLNLRAALLLELGRSEECQTILNFASGGVESNG